MVVKNTTTHTWDWYCRLVGYRASLASSLPLTSTFQPTTSGYNLIPGSYQSLHFVFEKNIILNLKLYKLRSLWIK
jgi:hypothetical protein